MKTWFLTFIVMQIHLKSTTMADDVPCTLPNSSETATCIKSTECEMFKKLVDFATPDAFAELKKRSAACLNSGSNMICCETQVMVTVKVDATTPLPLAIKEDHAYSSHKNFKFFDTKNCGVDKSPADKVANGQDAGLLLQPWAVRIGYQNLDKNISFRCAGTLITSRYIISAAHCFPIKKNGNIPYSIRLGEYNETSDPDCDENFDVCADKYQDIFIDTILVHPDYSPTLLDNDIALIRLKMPAKLNQNNINTICLPFDEKAKRIGTRYEVIGWGGTTNSTAYPVLQKAPLPAFDPKMCEEKYKKYKIKISDGQLCAGGEGLIDSCKGDSGGSLQGLAKMDKVRMVQYGIVSFGVNPCGVYENSPGVYTKVSAYLNWILDNIK